MKKSIYKTSDIPYGEDGYFETVTESFYDFPPMVSSYLTDNLFNEVKCFYNKMVSNIGEKGFTRATFILPSTFIKSKSTKRFAFSSEENRVKEINSSVGTFYFPLEVKKIIIKEFQNLAKSNNYYAECYYTGSDYINCNLEREQFFNCHAINVCIYTKKRFLENFYNEIEEFKKSYYGCLKEYNEGIAGISYEIMMQNLELRLYSIIRRYNAIPGIESLLSEKGIVLDDNGKSFVLKKTK